MISLYIIAGFFGAGKTTLIKNLIKNLDRKVAVLENEFGEVNIDEILLKNSDLKIIGIEDGSIFCSCKEDEFIDALIHLSEMDIDTLIVESSGIGDPGISMKLISIANEKAKEQYNLKGIIAVIDCEAYFGEIEAFPVISKQIDKAAIIILNKEDCISKDEIESIEKDILNRLNWINTDGNQQFIKPFFIHTQFGKVSFADLDFLLEKHANLYGSGRLDAVSISGYNTPENRPISLLLELTQPRSPYDILAFFNNFKDNIIRNKGFFVYDKKLYYLDGTISDYKIEKFTEDILETNYEQIFGKGRFGNFIIIITQKNENYVLKEIMYKSWNDFLNNC